MRRVGSRYLFHEADRNESYSMPDPDALPEAMWRMRYSKSPTRADILLVLSAAEAYRHFATHPATNATIIRQLRELRAAVKKAPIAPERSEP